MQAQNQARARLIHDHRGNRLGKQLQVRHDLKCGRAESRPGRLVHQVSPSQSQLSRPAFSARLPPPRSLAPVSDHEMTVDSDKLTEILADRLAAIVPDGIHVRGADGMLWYSCGGRFPSEVDSYRPGQSGTFVRDNFEANAEDLSDAESAANVARKALDELQDFVDEATRNPWPGTARPPWAFAEVRGEMLHLWYGDPDTGEEPVLACEPIPMATLQPLRRAVLQTLGSNASTRAAPQAGWPAPSERQRPRPRRQRSAWTRRQARRGRYPRGPAGRHRR
jgi:hypothetical protein